MRDIVMYGALIGQVMCGLGGIVAVAIMFRRRAKERRERAEQRARSQHA
jgi:hypothetical protein